MNGVNGVEREEKVSNFVKITSLFDSTSKICCILMQPPVNLNWVEAFDVTYEILEKYLPHIIQGKCLLASYSYSISFSRVDVLIQNSILLFLCFIFSS